MRNSALDVLKLVLAIFVVLLHARIFSTSSLELHHFLVNGLFRIAVPIFLIINGYFFLEKASSAHFARWFKKILVAYAAWSAIYIPLWASECFNRTNPGFCIAKTVFLGYFHLWYLPALLCAGTIIYFFNSLNRKMLLFAASLLFLIGTAIEYLPLLSSLSALHSSEVIRSPNWVNRNFLFFAFPLMYLGYFLRISQRDSFKSYSTRAMLLMLICLFLFIFEVNLTLSGTNENGFDMYLSLPFLCTCIFVLTLDLGRRYSKLELSRFGISKLASGIYFVHPIFLHIVSSLAASPTASVGLVLCLSLFTSALLSRIARASFLLP